MLFSRMQAIRRNWQVALVGLLMTAGLVLSAASLVPGRYVAETQLVLLPPHTQKRLLDTDLVNPYLGLGGLQSMADLVSRAMMDDTSGQALKNAGVADYSVQWDPASGGPVLLVQASGADPNEASKALTAVSDMVPQTLARMQSVAAISPTYFITTTVVAEPSRPRRSGKEQLRATGVALAVGLVLTLLGVSAVDGLRIRGRSGRPDGGRRAAAPDGAGAGVPDGAGAGVPESAPPRPDLVPATPVAPDRGPAETGRRP